MGIIMTTTIIIALNTGLYMLLVVMLVYKVKNFAINFKIFSGIVKYKVKFHYAEISFSSLIPIKSNFFIIQLPFFGEWVGEPIKRFPVWLHFGRIGKGLFYGGFFLTIQYIQLGRYK